MNNDRIKCEVSSCIYNNDGKSCRKDCIEVTDVGEEKCEPFCHSFEKYCGFKKD